MTNTKKLSKKAMSELRLDAQRNLSRATMNLSKMLDGADERQHAAVAEMHRQLAMISIKLVSLSILTG